MSGRVRRGHGRIGRAVFLWLACLLTPGGAAWAQSLSGLGVLPGGTASAASGISANGSVVVGGANTSSTGGAFRWSRVGGMVNLGAPPGDAVSSAYGVSADGTVVVGTSNDSSFLNQHAFRWTSAGGMVALGTLPGSTQAEAYGASADGSVVVGESFGNGAHAFRWTSAGGLLALGGLPGGGTDSYAYGVSADGSVVTGTAYALIQGNLYRRAFRWTDPSAGGAGMVSLGVPTGYSESFTGVVSADGAVVVGSCATAGGLYRAFRWTSAGGMVALALPPGFDESGAYALSADGSAVVCAAFSATVNHAFLWKSTLGMVDLNTYLPTLGINLTGWTLTAATGISADGLVIVGQGDHNGTSEAWVAKLSPCRTADFDDNGRIEPADVSLIVNVWYGSLQSGTLLGDFDGNGQVQPADVSLFVNRWFNALTSGC